VQRAKLIRATANGRQVMNNEADIFRELAPLLRARPELRQICRFGAQWASEHKPEPQGWAPFHIVTRGACLIDVADRVGVPLRAGDVAVLPHGGAHTVRARPTAAGPAAVVRVQRRLYDELLIKTNVDSEPDTKIICGRLCFEHAHDNMVLAALPPIVVVGSRDGPNESRLSRIVDAIRDELEVDRLGSAAIAAAIASSLMLIVLVRQFESERAGTGVLALLTRRQTAKALAGMLAEPARAWTLDELADLANTPRATLVCRSPRSPERSAIDRNRPLAGLTAGGSRLRRAVTAKMRSPSGMSAAARANLSDWRPSPF
jgi:AraC family transcriptional regulator, activator of mtrCDE